MKVKSIEEVTPRRVYAVRTSTGTFVADGLAHHNCYGCNVMSQGRQYEFGMAIDDLYGTGTAKALHQESKQLHPLTVEELQRIIADSKVQIKFYEEQ